MEFYIYYLTRDEVVSVLVIESFNYIGQFGAGFARGGEF